jgi:hypothetical protein
MKSLRVIGVLLVAAACVALAGAALANKGSKPTRPLPHGTKVQLTKPLAKPAPLSGRVGQAEESDTDNIQSVDVSSESETENSADTETGQPGEPAAGQGHEDPAGQDVNHECTGNCQE